MTRVFDVFGGVAVRLGVCGSIVVIVVVRVVGVEDVDLGNALPVPVRLV
jgi:hypothetical protein